MSRSNHEVQSTRPSAAQALDSIEESLFFIVGAGRSGTTLLQVMLANHPELTLPNESGFYSIIRRKNQRRLGELSTPETFKTGFDVALDFWRIRAFELDQERVWELCQARPPSWETLFLAILTALAEARGALRVGEKSPRHIEFLGLLAERFPRAKFIHMVRDPRAVASSYFRTFGQRSIGAKCERWKAAIVQHERHAEALGERYTLLRYEDLVREPEPTLRSVCTFLDCSFSEEMLNYHARDHLGFAPNQMHHMKNTLKPVFTSSLESWKEVLSKDQIALVEYALGDRMASFGYELMGLQTRLPAATYQLHIAMDKAGRLVDKLRTAVGLEVRRRSAR